MYAITVAEEFQVAEVVLGLGASHTTLMNTHWDAVNHLDRAHAFRNALERARNRLRRARPDAVLLIGPNHFRGYWLDLMPGFSIGVRELDCAGEHGTPKGSKVVDEAAATHLCEHLIGSGFDVAFSTRLSVDHGVSHAIQWIVAESALPLIPMVVNCFAPPLPGLDRCLSLGAAIASGIGSLPADMRVAVIASGGLSHRLPFPDWRKPQSDDDEFLVDSWKNGRGRWKEYEPRRREIVTSAPSRINEPFDRRFLSLLETGELHRLPRELNDEQLVSEGGNGANEIRAWLIMAAVLGHARGRTLCYAPMPEWLTGMAVAEICPEAIDCGLTRIAE